jgi:hypothetical protein
MTDRTPFTVSVVAAASLFAIVLSVGDAAQTVRAVAAYRTAWTAPEPPTYNEPDAWMRHNIRELMAHTDWEIARSPYALRNAAFPPASRIGIRVLLGVALGAAAWLLFPIVLRARA